MCVREEHVFPNPEVGHKPVRITKTWVASFMMQFIYNIYTYYYIVVCIYMYYIFYVYCVIYITYNTYYRHS